MSYGRWNVKSKKHWVWIWQLNQQSTMAVKRHEGCSISGSFTAQLKYHYFYRFFTYSVKRRAGRKPLTSGSKRPTSAAGRDPLWRQCQAGSLTGAVHLSKGNAGVLRWAQWGRKPHVEQKGKSSLDFDFQYEYRPWKRGLSILLTLGVLSKRCQKSYHRDNWLVAAKRS